MEIVLIFSDRGESVVVGCCNGFCYVGSWKRCDLNEQFSAKFLELDLGSCLFNYFFDNNFFSNNIFIAIFFG